MCPRLTYVGLVVNHSELAHEDHGGLHVIGDGSAGSGANLDTLIEVPGENGVLLECQASLRIQKEGLISERQAIALKCLIQSSRDTLRAKRAWS